MPARSAPRQMRSDLDNPKELHNFLEGQFLTEMMNLSRIRKYQNFHTFNGILLNSSKFNRISLIIGTFAGIGVF